MKIVIDKERSVFVQIRQTKAPASIYYEGGWLVIHAVTEVVESPEFKRAHIKVVDSEGHARKFKGYLRLAHFIVDEAEGVDYVL